VFEWLRIMGKAVIRTIVRDAAGKPYAFVTFYVNDDDARFQGGFAASVRDGDEIIIVPAIAGG